MKNCLARFSLPMVALICSSCFLLPERDPLTFKKQPYVRGPLQIDGYYVQRNDTVPSVIYHVLIFYRNGVILDPLIPQHKIPGIEADLVKWDTADGSKNMTSMWGLYKISGDSIHIEQYHPGNGGAEVFIRSGIIVDDSTFEITLSRGPYNGLVSKFDKVYHFRKFSSKPDSSNNIVK